MPKIDSRYDNINRIERDKDRLDEIHPRTRNEQIERMHADFIKGIAKLQERIASGETDAQLAVAREKLGNTAWSLEHLYDYDLTEFNLEALGITPSMGTHIPRGSR
ncbi:MAG: hypothetical protein J5742_03165 [Alphaproteobacteria bacterium]|nr:hypothetical protein [Alphaproteobacteria bacterium]